MKSVHLRIEGRVQGVGYRAWVEDEAVRRGLAGWVRNRNDRSVEAVFSGEDACGGRNGRRLQPWPARCPRHRACSANDYVGPPLARFTVLPTE